MLGILVFVAFNSKSTIFWGVPLCSLIVYGRLGENICLHLRDKAKQAANSYYSIQKMKEERSSETSTRLHGVTSQKKTGWLE
jgi:hypothetical protein